MEKIITIEDIREKAIFLLNKQQCSIRVDANQTELAYVVAYNDGVLALATELEIMLNRCSSVEEAADD